MTAVELAALPSVDPSTVWRCDTAPQVDGCAIIDDLDHVACFSVHDTWAVPVAPCCAAGDDWLPIGEGLAAATHVTTGGDGDGDPGDGDGDPGDGDGDPNCEAPTVECSGGECWAKAPSWTAEAKATLVDGIVTPGVWVPVDIIPDVECWELWGVGTHVCIVESCGALLLGTPADELALEPNPSCDFVGAWESTASVGGECFGLLGGVAVQLRTQPPVCVVHPWFGVSCWVPWFGDHARTILPCEAASAVDAGVWSVPYEMDLAELGTATCHDVVGTEFVFCLLGSDRVLLTFVDGQWVPQTDNTIDELDPSDPPCE